MSDTITRYSVEYDEEFDKFHIIEWRGNTGKSLGWRYLREVAQEVVDGYNAQMKETE